LAGLLLSTRHRKPRRRLQSGQGILEFALVFPILVLILVSVLQFAFILGAQIGITNAVREAARAGSILVTSNPAQATTNGTWTYQQLTNTLLPSYVQSYRSSSVVSSGTPRTEVCYTTYADPAGTTQVNLKVEAQYSHPLFLPIISTILDGFDGTIDGGLRIGAAEEIRVENPSDAPAPTLGSPTCNP
jgi:Flp pilus assembly protein TadG